MNSIEVLSTSNFGWCLQAQHFACEARSQFAQVIGKLLRKGVSLIALLYMFCAGFAHAQGYPSRTVTLILPFSAGSSVDVTAREIALVLQRKLNQPVIVDNKVGAGTMIASKFVADAVPDGYTLFYNGSSSLMAPETNSVTQGKNHVREMAFVSPIAYLPNVMMVSADLPVRTLSEFITYLKANPGKVAYASAGIGTSNHLQVEWFKQLTGTEMVHVPYKSNEAIYIDLASNRVQMVIGSYPVSKPYVASGKVRHLAVTQPNRVPNIDLPAAVETVPGFAVVPWIGISAPKGTPVPILAMLDRYIQEAIAEPALVAKLRSQYMEPMAGNSRQLQEFALRDLDNWIKIIKDSGLKIE